jgi:hypothetical protein
VRLSGLLHLLRAQNLAMRTIATNLSAGQNDLEAEMRFNLLAKLLERLPEKLLHLSAAQADYMRMLLFHARLVIVLISVFVQKVKFIY